MDIIIPSIRRDDLCLVLEDLANQTYKPHKVFIIDNAAECQKPCIINLTHQYSLVFPEIELVSYGKNIGVNRAWNIGFERCESEIIGVLNDDLRLQPNLLEYVEKAFTHNLGMGAVCPNTIKDELPEIDMTGCPELRRMKRREGWCWFASKGVVKTYKPIPPDLEIFYGDDWHFNQMANLGKPWYKMVNCFVRHTCGTAKLDRGKFKVIYNQEKRVYKSLWNG